MKMFVLLTKNICAGLFTPLPTETLSPKLAYSIISDVNQMCTNAESRPKHYRASFSLSLLPCLSLSRTHTHTQIKQIKMEEPV